MRCDSFSDAPCARIEQRNLAKSCPGCLNACSSEHIRKVNKIKGKSRLRIFAFNKIVLSVNICALQEGFFRYNEGKQQHDAAGASVRGRGKNEPLKRITSNDIAKLAGVSRSTVSRVINKYANVPEETRSRVMKVIKEHSYFPQLSGQLLTGMATRTIGLFWLSKSSISHDSLSSHIFMSVIDAAALRDYTVLTYVAESLCEKESALRVRRMFMEGRIDGGVFIGASTYEPLIEDLVNQGKVLGLFDYCPDDLVKPNRLTANFDGSSAEKTIDYLYEKGHRNIGVIDGDMSRLSSVHRHEGYMRGMMRHGLHLRNEWLTYGGITQKDGYKAALSLLTNCKGDYPTALCANNDSVAFGVYQACTELGLRIPEDISVMGNDGHDHGAYASPPLTTFAFDIGDMFSNLVSRLIDAIEDQPVDEHNVFFKSEFLERASVRDLTKKP